MVDAAEQGLHSASMVGSDAPAIPEGPIEMKRIARSWRTLVGGMAAGVVGVVMVAGGTASAEPLVPQPSLPGPVPMQPGTPPAQSNGVFPGGVNRFAPAPAQAPAQLPLPMQVPAPAAAPVPAVDRKSVVSRRRAGSRRGRATAAGGDSGDHGHAA